MYYDSKWNDGKRDADSWGRYTRRRKWWRDAELVEVTTSTEITPSPTPSWKHNPDEVIHSEVETGGQKKGASRPKAGTTASDFGVVGASVAAPEGTGTVDDHDSNSMKAKTKGWFGGGKEKKKRRSGSKSSSGKKSGVSLRSDDGAEHDPVDRWRSQERDDNRGAFGLGEDAVMGLS